MRKTIIALLTTMIVAAPLAAGVPASAASGRCTKRDAPGGDFVQMMRCLPGPKKGTLTWQPFPSENEACVRVGIEAVGLTCERRAGSLRWTLKYSTTTVPGGLDQAFKEAFAIITAGHMAFYTATDPSGQAVAFQIVKTRFGAYNAKAGAGGPGYFVTLSGVKRCLTNPRNDIAPVEAPC